MLAAITRGSQVKLKAITWTGGRDITRDMSIQSNTNGNKSTKSSTSLEEVLELTNLNLSSLTT